MKRLGLHQLHRYLLRRLGPQRWWPATGTFEIMVGAILTQSTSWLNVERVIRALKRANVLAPRRVLATSRARLESLVRPAGFFRQKARRLHRFSAWYVQRHRGRITPLMARQRMWQHRAELLELDGIGPETADAILLYAAQQPIAMVDAYTRRILQRHDLIRSDATYGAVQKFIMNGLPNRAAVFNEFHALLVETGKRYCRRRNPDCTRCPLGEFPRTLEVMTNGE